MNWIIVLIVASAAVAILLAHRSERRARVKADLAYAEILARRPQRGTRRLVTMMVGKRPCRECGTPLDMSDGQALTQYDDGSLGCAAHAQEDRA